MLKVGSKNIANVQVGSKKVKQIYAGSKLVWEAISLPANFADATPAQIKYAFDNKKVPSTWAVGDEHTITLTNGNVYALRILDMTEGRYSKTDGSGKTNCVLGFTSTMSYNDSTYNSSNWSDSYLYKTSAPYYLNLIPSEWQEIVSEVKLPVIVYSSGKGGSVDSKLFTPAMAEIVDTLDDSAYAIEGTVFDYYKGLGTASADIRRIYKREYGDKTIDTTKYWQTWLRTPNLKNGTVWNLSTSGGVTFSNSSGNYFGIWFVFAI